EWLAEARRPFLIVGSGAFYARAGEALQAFARLTDLPILSHLWDRGCIETPWPQYVGVTNAELTGAYALLAEADAVMLLGARLDHRLGLGRASAIRRDARLIRIDADAAELALGRQADLEIVADPRSALEQMTDAWQAREARPQGEWL